MWCHNLQFYPTFLLDLKLAGKILNWCLKEIVQWKRANKLMLTHNKMEVLLVIFNSTTGSGITPVLEGIAHPLKVCIWIYTWIR